MAVYWQAQPRRRGDAHLLILPSKGEVAGTCQTEGEVRENLCPVSSPSVTFGATSPWRGRIVKVVQRVTMLPRSNRSTVCGVIQP
jgi:hypothetical protein